MKTTAGLLVTCLAMIACGAPPEEEVTVMTTEPANRSLSRFDPQIDELLADMTLEEKVGQMTQADQEFLETDEHIRDYMLGSLLSGGGSDPETNSFEDWLALYEGYQARAMEESRYCSANPVKLLLFLRRSCFMGLLPAVVNYPTLYYMYPG